jgi:hypothetical protein
VWQLANFTLAVAEYPEMQNTFFYDHSADPLFTASFAPGPGCACVRHAFVC